MSARRTRKVSRSQARTYARQAREVLGGAENALELGNTRVAALAVVNACIRAADALCVAALGEHTRGDDHLQAQRAVTLAPRPGSPIGRAHD